MCPKCEVQVTDAASTYATFVTATLPEHRDQVLSDYCHLSVWQWVVSVVHCNSKKVKILQIIDVDEMVPQTEHVCQHRVSCDHNFLLQRPSPWPELNLDQPNFFPPFFFWRLAKKSLHFQTVYNLYTDLAYQLFSLNIVLWRSYVEIIRPFRD